MRVAAADACYGPPSREAHLYAFFGTTTGTGRDEGKGGEPKQLVNDIMMIIV